MKRITFIILFIASLLVAQEEANVLSYYASDNSLDGQPRIDMMNVIRFFPVFAIQDSVKDVNITIYYGDKISNVKADKMAGGKYWQSLLPEFHIGDAIQRVEVGSTIKLPKYFTNVLKSVDSTLKVAKIENRDIARTKNAKMESEIKSITNLTWMDVIKAIEILNSKEEIFGNNETLNSESLVNLFKNENFYKTMPENEKPKFIDEFLKLINDQKTFTKLIQIVEYKYSIIAGYKDKIKSIDYLKVQKDSLTASLYEKITGNLTDSSFSGPAIRKSDLRISDDCTTATLLYRYYKNNLRYRKALDPAEHLGIFRARYVPFPVVGLPSDNKVRLLRPMQEKVPTVFEVGLSFGDDVVSGDNTFNPVLSLSRLGVAMVITEQLFKADAEILGLALTYDFNSYASIGIGRNLAKGQNYPYFSFGINKKAFEQLLTALAGLF